MTEDTYVEMCAEKAREEARETLKNHLKPFKEVVESFTPTNMSKAKFKQFLKQTEVMPCSA
jgi:hypothetical protein